MNHLYQENHCHCSLCTDDIKVKHSNEAIFSSAQETIMVFFPIINHSWKM